MPTPFAWEYAPAPEARDIVTLSERYGLFIGGECVEPRSGDMVPDDLACHRGVAGRGRAGGRRGRRSRRRRRASGIRGRLVVAATRRAREVPVPHRPPPAGALARARRRGVARRRQADQGVARRRRAACRGALLLLRRLGRQARIRIPEPQAATARRRRPDHPVELPPAHARVEDRSRARLRQHRGAQARRDDAADGAHLRRHLPPGGAAAGRRQHRHGRRVDRRRIWSSTTASTRSRSRARPKSARRSSASSRARARS